jgi:hypothetical protein
MTNTIEEPQKSGLTYLTALIPREISQTQFLTEIANSLNEKNILPKTARQYTFPIVQNIWYGRYEDEMVKEEILSKLNATAQ